jgi:L-lactate permease
LLIYLFACRAGRKLSGHTFPIRMSIAVAWFTWKLLFMLIFIDSEWCCDQMKHAIQYQQWSSFMHTWGCESLLMILRMTKVISMSPNEEWTVCILKATIETIFTWQKQDPQKTEINSPNSSWSSQFTILHYWMLA